MIGIDIGGANLKIVDEHGVHIHYCPLWKETPVREILQEYSKADNAAVVMSGELADCFASKQEGIEFLYNAVRDVFPEAIFYGTDGNFHTKPVSMLAAANWLVMADFLRFKYPDCLLVDMGSTSTDIIPLNAWNSLKGQTDFDRLKTGMLLYYGLLRTPVSSLVRKVSLDGTEVFVSTEYFACSGDAHLLMKMISSDIYTTATPDSCTTSWEHCLRRMARMVCADVQEVGEAMILQIARGYVNEEMALVKSVVSSVMQRYGCKKILTVGIGSKILASWLNAHDLAAEMGSLSDAMPAWAVREAGLRTV